jgi:hypothetical protein
LKLFGW